MKFTISKDLIQKTMQHVGSAIDPRGTVPILSYIKVTAADNKLFLVATNLDTEASDSVECVVAENGSLAIPTSTINEIIKKLPNKLKLENITNIKTIKNLDTFNEELMINYKIICNKIIHNLLKLEEINFLKFRDILYDMFIYNLDISDCIWYIITTLITDKKIRKEHISIILIKTFCFFQYYNNNYRPIYHMENYFFNIAKIIYEL
jgi:hypothetical protein